MGNAGSLMSKLLWASLLSALLMAVTMVWNGLGLREETLEEAGLAAARSALQAASGARSFYASEIVPKVQAKGVEISHDFAGKEDRIPVPATLMHALSKPENGLRLYSRLPFRFRDAGAAKLDGFEEEALAWLEKNPAGEFHRIEQRNGGPVMRLARADVMVNASCVTCHNAHPDSPRRDWKLGDVRGALEVAVPIGATEARITSRFVWALALLLSCILLMVAIIVWVTRGVQRSLTSVVEGAERAVATNDFSQDVPVAGTSETVGVAESINHLLKKFRDTITDMRSSSDAVSGSSKSLSANSHEVRRNTAIQVDAVTSMAATVEQTSASLSETASNAGRVSEVVAITRTDVERALAVMLETASSIKSVAGMVQQSGDNIEVLSQSSLRIGNIVQVIKEIADQTNLLALNAAIEAARAGEQGRGFAVVADEVRNLAERTSSAAQEIVGLIDDIRTQIGTTVSGIHHANEQMDENLGLVARTEAALHEIGEDAQRMAEHVDNITHAIREQDDAIRHIAISMEKISHMTSENRLAIDASNQLADDLDQMADQARASVANFRV
jgi:methyl-accepting chemotaxis protein